MVSKNLIADFGGVGDGQRQTVNASITSGTKNLSVDIAIFASGDVGKAISFWSGSNYYNGTIATFTDSTHVVLSANAAFSLSAASTDILWGTDNTNAIVGATGSWRAWAQTQTNPADPPVLIIPDGRYVLSSGQALGQGLNYQVQNARWQGQSGNAANCIISQLSNGEMRLGGNPGFKNVGLSQTSGNSARIQTARKGDSTLTLVDPTNYGSRIIVGGSVIVTAFDMQGLYNSYVGSPPNPFFFEYNTITAYSGGTTGSPGAGIISLQNPLTQDYKSTYPSWGSDTIFGNDQGGPATIWIPELNWTTTLEFDDITLDCPHNQISGQVSDQVYRRCVIDSPGLYPTVCRTFLADNCTYPNIVEMDKMVDQATFTNCSLRGLQVQSASPNKLYISGGTCSHLETPKFVQLDNVAFTSPADILLGASGYGRTDRVILNNCTGIAILTGSGASTDDLGGQSVRANASSFFTFVGGVIKFAKSLNDTAGGNGQANLNRYFVPGTWLSFDDKYIDQVTDVYEDGTYCYVQFAKTTDWPFTPVSRLKVHPCPDITVNNCSGTAATLEDWNQAPKRLPFNSYTKRTYVAGATAATPQTSKPFLVGTLKSAKFTPTLLYTGASLTYSESQFSNWALYKNDYTTVNLAAVINMKIAGERDLVNAGAPTGGQVGDTLTNFTSAGSVWFAGGSNSFPVFSSNVTNGDTPTITVEIITDQGIPAPVPSAVAPLIFRLRA